MDPLTQTQQLVSDRLKSFQYFNKIPVITEQIGDIENAIQLELAKIGLCVVILTVTANMENQDTPGPMLILKVLAHIREQVTLNRGPGGTGKPAAEVACVVAGALHGFTPTVNRKLVNGIYGRKENFISLMPDPQRQGSLVYEVEFETHAGIQMDIV